MLQQLANLIGNILAGGIGGITFVGTWLYLVTRWLQGGDFGGFQTIKIPIPWLW